MRLFLLAVVVACAQASPQYVKSRYTGVKGGHGGHFQTGENLVSYNNYTRPGHGGRNFTEPSEPIDYQKGVCYIEIPTASLAKDPAHVPAGNGSRPDLSRIRSCCKGYIRNIHNYRICDPVCTNECVNALCTEPETCTCFPDHVKNLAGFCIPTCPIGCQNGYCDGGECICKNGYRLDSESKFCVPICRENCGGIGNCTAPNTCECNSGYRASPEGSCKPHCDRCGQFGICVAPNDCRCSSGYAKNHNGDCVPQCTDNCRPNGRCVGVNVCHYPSTTTTTTKPIGQHPQGQNTPRNPAGYPYTTRAPNYNGYPHQQYPDNQQTYDQQNYYENQQYQTNQFNQPSHQQSYYPDNQQYQQPENHRPNYPGGQISNQHSNSDQQTSKPNRQQSNHDQKPNPQPIYYNPDQQPNYPPYKQNYNNQKPNYPDSQQPNSNQAHFPNGQYYPDQQNYPGNQHYNPQYPHQQQNYPSPNNISNPYQSFTSHQQAQNLYPDSQMGNVERLCSKPCINGICDEQGRCICNEGYVLDNSDDSINRCKPYCPGGCPNGICSSPNFCICNVGFHKDFSVKGRTNCVKRIRRSAEGPVNVAELLVFEIPDDEDIEL